MNSNYIRECYLNFFKNQNHVEIPSSPLVPKNDPTTLFTSSGMQPLVPYLLGQPHPLGKRIVDVQKSFRAGDIEEVGDNRHITFFEMLGNWSFGDYFKKEQLSWIFEILTKGIGLDPKRLFVTVFEGNENVPKDEESISIWKEIFAKVNINAKVGEKIFLYPAKKNWWSRSGEPKDMPPGEPGGPDSEVFFDFGEKLKLHEKSQWKNEKCHPNCDCGRYLEIANSVFMQYKKESDGSLKELSQKNVDFGGGLERLVAATIDNPDIFATDLFMPIIEILEKESGKKYSESVEVAYEMRIISDHIKASVMMITDGVLPSNKTQGYILRRLIRRLILHGNKLGLSQDLSYISTLVDVIAKIYEKAYPSVLEKSSEIKLILLDEAKRFHKTLSKGLIEIEKVKTLTGKIAFSLYETYGFPWEMTVEIATGKGLVIDRKEFESEFKKHQEISRSAAKGMFKGGLADSSVQTTKLHTAHHLLLAALQKLIDPNIKQRGSNITGERLRMDFNYSKKLLPEEIEKIENMINQKIKENLKVTRVEMDKSEAEKLGAQMEFGHKYPDRVSVYFIGEQKNYFSAEFCGGPHVENTGSLGVFKVLKEESLGSGIRRLYASLK